ncbi:hypothetical protein DMENIID0001_164900 [Sergentomyia squamirostris]
MTEMKIMHQEHRQLLPHIKRERARDAYVNVMRIECAPPELFTPAGLPPLRLCHIHHARRGKQRYISWTTTHQHTSICWRKSSLTRGTVNVKSLDSAHDPHLGGGDLAANEKGCVI